MLWQISTSPLLFSSIFARQEDIQSKLRRYYWRLRNFEKIFCIRNKEFIEKAKAFNWAFYVVYKERDEQEYQSKGFDVLKKYYANLEVSAEKFTKLKESSFEWHGSVARILKQVNSAEGESHSRQGQPSNSLKIRIMCFYLMML